MFNPIVYTRIEVESCDSIYHNSEYNNDNFVQNVTVITLNEFDFNENKTILTQLETVFNQSLDSKYNFYIVYLTLDCDLSPNCIKKLSRIFIANGTKLVESDDEYYGSDYYRANLVWDLRKRIEDNLIESRFKDNEEFKYSLRSVDMYAPWVRHIYVVTSGHYPNWLNKSHPKIKIIKHSDFFSNLSHLPTFNTNAIECNLHKIKGLSNKFLYFNDDFILNRPISFQDFYTESKGIKFRSSLDIYAMYPFKCTSLLNDGKCDLDCFKLECGFDGNHSKNSLITPKHNHIISFYDALAYTSTI